MLDEGPDASDADILRRAVAEDRIVISVDLDFGEMVARRRLEHRGVLVLRMDEATGAEKAATVIQLTRRAGQQLYCHLATYREGRLRIGYPWIGE